jgi:hypothetical protein
MHEAISVSGAGEHVLASGKYAGLRLREVDRDDLAMEGRGGADPSDRAAIREYIAFQRLNQTWIGGRRDRRGGREQRGGRE